MRQTDQFYCIANDQTGMLLAAQKQKQKCLETGLFYFSPHILPVIFSNCLFRLSIVSGLVSSCVFSTFSRHSSLLSSTLNFVYSPEFKSGPYKIRPTEAKTPPPAVPATTGANTGKKNAAPKK